MTTYATDLIDLVASVEMPRVFNPWRHQDPLDLGNGPMGRRARLARHFDCKPRLLLVGEAPGYQGCHFSGVPFTNERLIINGLIPRVGGGLRFTARDRPWSEPSATVVWGALRQHGIAETTVLWNAFAWHPHEATDLYSNRTPTKAELRAGADVLRAVVRQFDGAEVVAVGRKAESALWYLGVEFKAVRHPSMGGAAEFREGLAEIVGRVAA